MAVTMKPTIAGTLWSPACRPSNGGRIRLPAPKNIEKSATPTMSDCLGARRSGAFDWLFMR